VASRACGLELNALGYVAGGLGLIYRRRADMKLMAYSLHHGYQPHAEEEA
jgi:hypothetical protein